MVSIVQICQSKVVPVYRICHLNPRICHLSPKTCHLIPIVWHSTINIGQAPLRNHHIVIVLHLLYLYLLIFLLLLLVYVIYYLCCTSKFYFIQHNNSFSFVRLLFKTILTLLFLPILNAFIYLLQSILFPFKHGPLSDLSKSVQSTLIKNKNV